MSSTHGNSDQAHENSLKEIPHKIANAYYLAWAFNLVFTSATALVVYYVGNGKKEDAPKWLQLFPAEFVPAGMLLLLILSILFFVICSYKVWRIVGKRFTLASPIRSLYAEILKIHNRSDGEGLLWVQTAFRAILVALLVSEVHESYRWSGDPSDGLHNLFPVVFFNYSRLTVGAFFFVGSIIAHIWALKRLRKKPSKVGEMAKVFSRLAWFDWIAITLIALFSFLPGRDYHLAYLITILGVWAMKNAKSAIRMTILVGFGVIAISVGHTFILNHDTGLAKALGYRSTDEVARLFAGLAIPKMLFWMAIAVMLSLLRALRGAKEKIVGIFETVAGMMDLCAFAKDRDRRMTYATKPMLDRLGLTLDQVQGRTDEEIPRHAINMSPDQISAFFRRPKNTDSTKNADSIHTKEYHHSDEAVLNTAKNANDHWQIGTVHEQLEPSFDCGRDGQELIWTKKRALTRSMRGMDGILTEITGLVGVCEPGTPFQISNTAERIFGHVPFYCTMKDRAGRIVWASEKYCKLVEKLLPKAKGLSPITRLRSMNGGKGPTDQDFYDHYETLTTIDRHIVHRAESALASNRDPIEALKDALTRKDDKLHAILPEEFYQGGEVVLSGWTEYHQLKGDTEGFWVQVVKVPWWDKKTKEVKGVMVFFRDIHRYYLRKGAVWRWMRKYMAMSLPLYGETVDGNVTSMGAEPRLRLATIQRQVIEWIRIYAELDRPSTLSIRPRPAKISPPISIGRWEVSELQWLEGVMHDIYPAVNTKFRLAHSAGFELQKGKNELQVILFLLALNAAEACLGKSADGRMGVLTPSAGSLSTVLAEVSVENSKISISVVNNHGGFDPADTDCIMTARRLTDDGLGGKSPCSGIYLIRKITGSLGGIFTLTSMGLHSQVTACVEIPLDSVGSAAPKPA